MEKITSFLYEDGTECVHVENINRLNLFKTFDCGQAFRFEPVSLLGKKYEYSGVAFGKAVIFAQDAENELFIYNSTKEEYLNIWRNYFSLDVDYLAIDRDLNSILPETVIERAVEASSGIRILRQDSWEALCSFIISQNNNIPRIKKIIATLCEKYGNRVELFGRVDYTFPTPNALMLSSGRGGSYGVLTKKVYEEGYGAGIGEGNGDGVIAVVHDGVGEAQRPLSSVNGNSVGRIGLELYLQNLAFFYGYIIKSDVEQIANDHVLSAGEAEFSQGRSIQDRFIGSVQSGGDGFVLRIVAISNSGENDFFIEHELLNDLFGLNVFDPGNENAGGCLRGYAGGEVSSESGGGCKQHANGEYEGHQFLHVGSSCLSHQLVSVLLIFAITR